MSTWQQVTPEAVLRFDSPTDGFLCPLSANSYGVEFLQFEVRDYDSNKIVYQSPTPDMLPPDCEYRPTEEQLRSVRYQFPAEFLTYKTIRTSLEFKVGDQPLDSFRMVELHYLHDQLMRVYDFTFGFCIPSSTNTWEAIYDVPEYSPRQIREFIDNPCAHKSDSFYFVNDRLIMHNKAEYEYLEE